MSKDNEKLTQLKNNYTNLKSLGMGEKVLVPLREEIESLGGRVDESNQVDIRGDVHTEGGDFTGRDKIIARLLEGSIEISGDVNGSITINSLQGDFSIPISNDEDANEIFLEAYYRALAEECSCLPFGIIEIKFMVPGRQDELHLDDVYVNLDVVAIEQRKDEDKHAFGSRLARGNEGKRTALLDAISGSEYPFVVLLGNPGSGKTTFINYLVYQLVNGKNGLPEVFRDKPVVHLVLRKIAKHIPVNSESGDAQMLWNAVRTNLDKVLGEDIGGKLFLHLMERIAKEGCVLLLDGLDEVPEASLRRHCLMDAVQKLVWGLKKGSRVILTARPYAYADENWQFSQFHSLTLAPFSEDQMKQFVQRWYEAVRLKMSWSQDEVQFRSSSLIKELNERENLADLASRPLLLTLIAAMHTSGGHLPGDSTELYERSVRLLLTKWESKNTDSDDNEQLEGKVRLLDFKNEPIILRKALETLAYKVHERQWKERIDGDDIYASDIPSAEVLDVFSKILSDNINPRVLLRYLEHRTGLLICREEDVYAFPHLSFQEYLAACYLTEKPKFASRTRDLIFEDPDYWWKVFLLAVGKKKQGGMEGAVYAIHTLLPRSVNERWNPEEIHFKSAILAGQALLDLGLLEEAHGEEVYETQIEHAQQWLMRLVEQGKLLPKERVVAAEILGRLGDLRFDPEFDYLPCLYNGKLEPLYGFVPIPAGSFVMGSKAEDADSRDDELGNPEKMDISYDYWIQRYPVTVAQYGMFVTDGGYDQECWWTELGWQWRQGGFNSDADNDFGVVHDEKRPLRDSPMWWNEQIVYSTRPVVGVCWFEALAYSNWLDSQLNNEKLDRPRGYIVRLPQEDEWEKAARNSDDRAYPWGNNEWDSNNANIDKTIGTPTPVGMYSLGCTTTGLHDICGNVWEWTLSLYHPYPYDRNDGRNVVTSQHRRVARGGSWSNLKRFAIGSFRHKFVPDACNNNLGFRIVLSQKE